MRVAELTAALLDYWVARAEHLWCTGEHLGIIKGMPKEMPQDRWFVRCRIDNDFYDFAPSSRWDQGGPIIDANAIGFRPISDAEWEAEEYITAHTGRGPTPLIAAMRAYVTSAFGGVVPDDIRA